MPGRWDVKSIHEYQQIAIERLQDPMSKETLPALALIAAGALFFVVFIIVALVGRAWSFSFLGMLFSLALAAGGMWLLVRPR